MSLLPDLSALTLMERHVEALYTHDAAGRIVRVREHDGAPAPRFFLGRTAGGSVRRYRRDVDDVLRGELDEASADDSRPDGAGDPAAVAAEAAAADELAPAFRGRGYAPRVVAAWARAVRALDVEPLYSTSWQNTASRTVARKLGLVAFGSDLHLA